MTDDNLQGAVLEIRYVSLANAAQWDRNPKLHDLPSLIDSIEKHGFRDAPIFDGTLNAIVAGNGRTAALQSMREQGKEPPQGVAVDADGAWYVPMQFGIDAQSKAAAESFGVSHNNLTMAGGDFGVLDMAHLWDRDQYLDLLTSLDETGDLPVDISVNDFEILLDGGGEVSRPDFDDLDYGEPGERDFWPYVRVQVSPETLDRFESFMGDIQCDDEAEKFRHLMECVDATLLGRS